jgi:sugar/nucleoside kinase (ribokinase family)
MQALIIGHTYIDIGHTYIDVIFRLPVGDEKHVASAYAISFGGNAVTAAFCAAKLSIVPDLLTTVADDWLGCMFLEMAAKYTITIHPRNVSMSSLSFIMPKQEMRAIVRCRDDSYFNSFPRLDLTGCRALHLDGHQADAAIHYAKLCRSAKILTSLDGGGLRSNTHDLLAFVAVAIVATRLCEQMRLTPPEMLDYLKSRRCRIGGVTVGERGLIWYDETGTVRSLAALAVPADKIVDTSGAGDVFHGACLYSHPTETWESHFRFARAASAHKIQHLGNETGLPSRKDIDDVRRRFGDPAEAVRGGLLDSLYACAHGTAERLS